MAVSKYYPNGDGVCPHCGVAVRFIDSVPSEKGRNTTTIEVSDTPQSIIVAIASRCPACHGNVIALFIASPYSRGPDTMVFQYLAYPRAKGRVVPMEVPAEIREDFLEAAEVLPISEKASAALARRCLQSLLIDRGFDAENLSDGIDDAMRILPSHLSENLDMVRNVGNFATHPKKSTNTGEIIEVEADEASFLLDLLSLLFDFFYHQPALAKIHRTRVNEKLRSVGKPPLKSG